MATPRHTRDLAATEKLIEQICVLLRGAYTPPQYAQVILPFTLLRRLDCLLASSKHEVTAEYQDIANTSNHEDTKIRLDHITGPRLDNWSDLNFEKLKANHDDVDSNLKRYIAGFSEPVREIFDYFEFEKDIKRLSEAKILHQVIFEFARLDLYPANLSHEQMDTIFENLSIHFNALAGVSTANYFIPHDISRLMVRILFIDHDLLSTDSTPRTLLDPACGNGSMLTEALNHFHERRYPAPLSVHGQDYNRHNFATTASASLMKNPEQSPITPVMQTGSSLTDDKFADQSFDYLITIPPFGMDWKGQQRAIQQDRNKNLTDSRFSAGLPRANDASLLFLQHLWHKREPVQPDQLRNGSRLAILFTSSPMFAGRAGSGESNIRRWIMENDWLEAIVALPEHLFYNSGIGTYLWILTNRKPPQRQNQVQLVDARNLWTVGRNPDYKRRAGKKRRHLADHQLDEIVRLYDPFTDNERSKLFANAEFGFTRVAVERPLRLRYQMTTDDKARFLDACPQLLDDIQAIDSALGRRAIPDWDAAWSQIETVLRNNTSHWKAAERNLFRSVFTQTDPNAAPVSERALNAGPEPDPALRSFVNVPLTEDVDLYYAREIHPHIPDAWMDRTKDNVGYEISFNRHFYRHEKPRPMAIIDQELKQAKDEVARLMSMMTP